MNVYRVRSVVEVETKGGNLRQVYSTVDTSTFKGDDWIVHFNGKPYPKPWKKVTFKRDRPKLKRADFLNWDWKVLVCNERAMNLVGAVLRKDGEVFPSVVAGETGEYYFYNPTNLLKGAFDAKNGNYVKLPTHTVLMAPAFHAHKIPPGVQLFKVPEVSGIYCVERTGRAEDGEFKALIDRHQLTGLEFKLMWSDGKGATKRKATKGKTKVIQPPAPLLPKKPAGSDRPLKAAEKRDVALSIKRGYEHLELNPTTPPAKAQKAIRGLIDSIASRKANLKGNTVEDVAVNIGCLWGQTVCEVAGWEWCFAKLGGKPALAVASPDRSHIVAPMRYVHAQLKKRPPADNSSLLLFNMIRAKKLPKAAPNAYVQVG